MAAADFVRKCTFRTPANGGLAQPLVESVWRIEDGVPVAPAVPNGPVAPDPYLPKL